LEVDDNGRTLSTMEQVIWMTLKQNNNDDDKTKKKKKIKVTTVTQQPATLNFS
jgi:hypothetical protein